jgi:hypothetical protein
MDRESAHALHHNLDGCNTRVRSFLNAHHPVQLPLVDHAKRTRPWSPTIALVIAIVLRLVWPGLAKTLFERASDRWRLHG